MRAALDAASVTYRIVGCVPNELVYATRLPFDPGSPPYGATSYVEGCWSPMLARCHCNLGARK